VPSCPIGKGLLSPIYQQEAKPFKSKSIYRGTVRGNETTLCLNHNSIESNCRQVQENAPKDDLGKSFLSLLRTLFLRLHFITEIDGARARNGDDFVSVCAQRIAMT
jgi:hypothetical protein